MYSLLELSELTEDEKHFEANYKWIHRQVYTIVVEYIVNFAKLVQLLPKTNHLAQRFCDRTARRYCKCEL